MTKQIYGLYYGDSLVFAGDARTCAAKIGITPSNLYNAYSKGRKRKGLAIDVIEREYAVYKGEECLVIGDVNECAEAMNIKPEMIRWYTSPVCARRVSQRKKEYATGRTTVIMLEPEVDEWPSELMIAQ